MENSYVPPITEARLNDLYPDMQYAVLRHDDIHAALERAFIVRDSENAFALLEDLCELVDTSRLDKVYSETNVHREIQSTAQLIAQHLPITANMRAALDGIIEKRTRILEVINQKPVQDIIFISDSSIEKSAI